MVNMRMLIRIVFVIFIANGIDCLGKVCDSCCDCFKGKKEEKKKEKIEGEEKKDDEINDENNDEKKKEKIMEYEEIKEDEDFIKNEKITAKSLVNEYWYNAKEKNLVLKIFKKKGNEDFPSKNNGEKISIKLDEEGNPKIVYQNLEGKKYAFFEIKTKRDEMIYLYCSDVESSTSKNGIFERTPHRSISVIACDTENVKNMRCMFYECSSLTKLDLKNFNTTNVTDMHSMFYECRSLTELDLKNFNTTKVTDMEFMFYGCRTLKNLDISNFNTLKVTNMGSMFSVCISLENLDISNFSTTKDTIMEWMFSSCSNLNVLKISDNFYTTNDQYKKNMFNNCSLPQEKINEILGKNK